MEAVEAAVWLVAGIAAGLADYGLGLGFGLAASLILVVVFGRDPRTVAAAAAAVQILTIIPALMAHRRAGNIAPEAIDNAKRVIVVLAASSTAAALAASTLAVRLSIREAHMAYALALATLVPPLLLLARHGKSARTNPAGSERSSSHGCSSWGSCWRG
ncbi:TSUP family transporter [Hyperthermus butylicus]|uniref:Probable membrane transporter protein n=1 Tax=Hyperthermus butylicus (strain DSM 5456 / JCM 9403 / PLM1-5) TaxID=415426 RepID=A2BMV8_HYPBU|nr:TSUP family transporter [Hyperthermus butylicus]ABM81319.1 hypothetical protein Hbut_1497 [Hyperthermus butylicus DSM 5456]